MDLMLIRVGIIVNYTFIKNKIFINKVDNDR